VRWLADECVSPDIVARLRRMGHDVDHILELDRGADDDSISIRAREQNRLLLTEDNDFGERVFRRGESIPGIVLLRIESEEPRAKVEKITGGD
jgi:predicted nuclease of predicted toxin-antitoxin system